MWLNYTYSSLFINIDFLNQIHKYRNIFRNKIIFPSLHSHKRLYILNFSHTSLFPVKYIYLSSSVNPQPSYIHNFVNIPTFIMFMIMFSSLSLQFIRKFLPYDLKLRETEAIYVQSLKVSKHIIGKILSDDDILATRDYKNPACRLFSFFLFNLGIWK